MSYQEIYHTIYQVQSILDADLQWTQEILILYKMHT